MEVIGVWQGLLTIPSHQEVFFSGQVGLALLRVATLPAAVSDALFISNQGIRSTSCYMMSPRVLVFKAKMKGRVGC